jgi:hypothetical protein
VRRAAAARGSGANGAARRAGAGGSRRAAAAQRGLGWLAAAAGRSARGRAEARWRAGGGRGSAQEQARAFPLSWRRAAQRERGRAAGASGRVSAAGRASAWCELEQALGAGGAGWWLGMGATQVLAARSEEKQAEQSRPKRRAVQTQKLWAGTGGVWVRRQNKAVASGGAAGTGSSAGVSSATQEQLERSWSTEAALGDGAGLDGGERQGTGSAGTRSG